MNQTNFGNLRTKAEEDGSAGSLQNDNVLEMELKERNQFYHVHFDEAKQVAHEQHRTVPMMASGEHLVAQEGFDAQVNAPTPGAYLVRPRDALEDSATSGYYEDETNHEDETDHHKPTMVVTAMIVDEEYEIEMLERQMHELKQLSATIASASQHSVVVRADIVNTKRRRYIIGGLVLVLTLLIMTVIVLVTMMTRDRNRPAPTVGASSLIDKVAPTLNVSNDDVEPMISTMLNNSNEPIISQIYISSDEVEAIVRFVNQITLSDQKNLSYPISKNATPEEQALEWFILNGEVLPDQNTSLATQKFAVVVLAFALKSPSLMIEKDFDEFELLDERYCSSGNPCTFVDALYMSDEGLTGSIPNDIALLTRLTTMYFSNNSLTGTVPWDLMMSRMTSLRAIDLKTNRFSGSLPTAKPGAWPELEWFWLQEIFSTEPFHPVLCICRT